MFNEVLNLNNQQSLFSDNQLKTDTISIKISKPSLIKSEINPKISLSSNNINKNKDALDSIKISKENNNKNASYAINTNNSSNTDKKSIKYSSYSIAKLYEDIFLFKIFDKILHVWDENLGYYIPLTNENSDQFIRKNAPIYLKHLLNSSNIKDIVNWIKAECNNVINESDLLSRRNYIAFKNGILNISNQKLINHSPEYNFTSIINANYSYDPLDSIYFENFMLDICQNDHLLYTRIQELFGYVISEIRDLKIIPYLTGPKDTGKSIILKLLEHLVGVNFCTSLSLDELNKKDYLNRLLSKKLNTCGETSELTLKRLDVLKKLSGGDRIMAKALYEQPVSFVNMAALVFAGNHLPSLNNLDRSNAFSERLLIIPFDNAIPKEKQDPLLFKKLLKEIDYIANWSTIGLLRLIHNNYQFTNNLRVNQLQKNYTIHNNSVEQFFLEECIQSTDAKIFSSEIENAYFSYCEIHNVIPATKIEFHRHLKSKHNLQYRRFRLGNENKNGYIGISLKINSNLMED